jgi:hypothetical protein
MFVCCLFDRIASSFVLFERSQAGAGQKSLGFVAPTLPRKFISEIPQVGDVIQQ